MKLQVWARRCGDGVLLIGTVTCCSWYREKENIQERTGLFTRDEREGENPDIPELSEFKDTSNSHFWPPQPLNYCQRKRVEEKDESEAKCHIFL